VIGFNEQAAAGEEHSHRPVKKLQLEKGIGCTLVSTRH
jgi:hypothetical protein